MTERARLVITAGDPAGIGPDVVLVVFSRLKVTYLITFFFF